MSLVTGKECICYTSEGLEIRMIVWVLRTIQALGVSPVKSSRKLMRRSQREGNPSLAVEFRMKARRVSLHSIYTAAVLHSIMSLEYVVSHSIKNVKIAKPFDILTFTW